MLLLLNLNYLKNKYPNFYFVSSTTKVITDFEEFKSEVDRKEFSYVVPDFRLNKDFENLEGLTQTQKNKVEFLCNECCKSPTAQKGYRFSEAMKNPGFISIGDIENKYVPMGFSNFKIEGRSLGSALILEFLLYYMTKPEYHINVREEIYLDNMLDLF